MNQKKMEEIDRVKRGNEDSNKPVTSSSAAHVTSSPTPAYTRAPAAAPAAVSSPQAYSSPTAVPSGSRLDDAAARAAEAERRAEEAERRYI